MRKIALTIFMITLFISPAKSCEICGCGVGNHYIGLLPQFSHQFMGARYRFSSFHTTIKNSPDQFSNDFYQTIELWGGWNIGKHLQVLAFLPYNIVYQRSDEGITHHNGMGDASVLVNYKLLSKIAANTTQQLWIGGGIKLPTGRFSIDQTNPDLAAIANSQVGSGSTDFLLSANYNLKRAQWGISSNASYKINTPNKDEYKFGNVLSANSFFFYSLPVRNTVLLPNAGLLYEHAAASDLQKEKIAFTGGNLFTAAAGAELSFSKINVGINIQAPLAQDFAEGQTKTKLKGMMHITFAF
jgi:hypothetical protein